MLMCVDWRKTPLNSYKNLKNGAFNCEKRYKGRCGNSCSTSGDREGSEQDKEGAGRG